MKKMPLILLATLIGLMLYTQATGQDAVPLTVETKTDDYVVLDPQLYVLLAQHDAKLNLALDELAEIKASLQADAPATTKAAVNINAATYDELLTVPGIGPVKAGSIIADRGQYGAFADWSDLQARVSGVGPSTIADMQAGGAVLE